MACGGCAERAQILKNNVPNVRSMADAADIMRKLVATVTKRPQPWVSPPSVNKDGTPYKPHESEGK